MNKSVELCWSFKEVLIYEYKGIQEFEYQNYHNNLKF